jgi:hypothetical protein
MGHAQCSPAPGRGTPSSDPLPAPRALLWISESDPNPLGRRVLLIRARLADRRLDWWQGLCLTGSRLWRFYCHQNRQVGLHLLQVDLRVSHMLLCWLQVSFHIPQVGLSGSHVLLSGHLSPR